MVNVILAPLAKEDVESIFSYIDDFSRRASQAFKNEVVAAARRLRLMPEMGPREPLLEKYDRNYRYVIVQRRYKLIYLYENQTCFILMVWDCRRNPKQLEGSARFEI